MTNDELREIWDARVEKHLDRLKERLDESYEEAPCGSPIERRLFIELMFIATGWHATVAHPVSDHNANAIDRLCVIPQHPVGPYKLDFAVHAEFQALPELATVRVAVECDGHAFHEKTKEQAARDKARDRYLALEGYTVMRFTGTEIHRDAPSCAEQVGIFIFKRIDEAIERRLKIEREREGGAK